MLTRCFYGTYATVCIAVYTRPSCRLQTLTHCVLTHCVHCARPPCVQHCIQCVPHCVYPPLVPTARICRVSYPSPLRVSSTRTFVHPPLVGVWVVSSVGLLWLQLALSIRVRVPGWTRVHFLDKCLEVD